MFHSIYKSKTTLITGHTGFKGSWLAIWLKELGANIIGYSPVPPSEPNNFKQRGSEGVHVCTPCSMRELPRLLRLPICSIQYRGEKES